MGQAPTALVRLIAAEAAAPVAPAIETVAVAARHRHGPGIVAVLFYGSCLRDKGGDVDKIADLYLLADSYSQVHPGLLMRGLNRLLPPNVYYIEAPFEGRTVRAKYAIMTLVQFERRVGCRTLQSYFWARFAQPTIVLWAREEAIRERLVRALADAVVTTAAATRPLLEASAGRDPLWARAFREAYRTELRAEAPERGVALYHAFADRYDAITRILDPDDTGWSPSPKDRLRAERTWRRRRILGKTLSVLRLIKSAFTFHDGAAYLMWKIKRHSGVSIELTPWQRRHPILASGTLFWKIYRAGGFR